MSCCLPMCILKFWMFLGGGVHFLLGAVLVIIAIVFKASDLDYLPDDVHGNTNNVFLGILSKK